MKQTPKPLLVLLFFCSLISLTKVYAQSPMGQVNGKILNSQNGEAIAFANVQLRGSKIGGSTNEFGDFQLNNVPYGTYRLLISAVGFSSINQQLIVDTERVSLRIEMEENTSELGEVVVQAWKQPSYQSLNRLDVPARDIPLTTTSVGQELISMRNVDEIHEALKSATGIRPMNTYGGFQTFTIRGFINFLMMVDGVRDERHNIAQSAPSTNLANVESIELLKGPASVLFGHSALGGVINITRKQPSAVFQGELMGGVGSFNNYRMQAGVGGPINDKLSYRIDFGKSSVDGFRGEGFTTNNAYLAFDYQASDRDLFQIKVQANRDLYNTDSGVPVLPDGSIPANVPRNARYNHLEDYLRNDRYDFQLRYEHTFANGAKISNLLSYFDDNIKYLSTEELQYNATLDSINRTFPFYFNHETKPLQNQLEYTQTINTGGVEQKFLLGYSVSILDRKTFRGNVGGPGAFTPVSIVDPVVNQGALIVTERNFIARMENVHGFYAQDWINLSAKVKALVGLRYDVFNGTYYTDQIDTDRNVTQEGDRVLMNIGNLTYRTGLVFQANDAWSLYGSYSTYFKPTRTISVAGEMFDPETGYQGEIGTRLELSDKLTATAAAFYIVRTNILENLGGGVLRNIGEGQSRGLEFEMEARPLSNLQLRGGYAFTEATVRSHRDEAFTNPNAGNTLPFAPRGILNSWAQYTVTQGMLRGLGFGAGVFHQTENFTNAANTYALPAYTLLDAAISYGFAKSELRINVNNVTDTHYYANAIFGNQFMLGNPRNFMLSFRQRF